MSLELRDDQIQTALQNCADEPVHIPGFIQDFGWILAYSIETQNIAYISDNAAAALNRPLTDVLGQHVRDVLGREIWHGLQNAVATRETEHERVIIGSWSCNDDGPAWLAAAWQSGAYIVVEFEEKSDEALLSVQEMQAQANLIGKIQGVSDIQSLLDLTTRQLRHLTGYDRVMVYKFDPNWNGEVVAEAHTNAVEPYLGLHFPNYDIPSQARAIMARIPLRLIADIDDGGVPISAANPDLPPLDITLGETRGTSPVHMQYLRNMGIRATMTLSIVLEGELWGMISFHHRRARVTPGPIRLILKSFLDVFCLKLGLLSERNFTALSDKVDRLQQELHTMISEEPKLTDLLDALGSTIQDTFQACGFYIRSDQGEYAHGQVPAPEFIEELVATLPNEKGSSLFSDNIAKDLFDGNTRIAPIAGVAAVFHSNDWLLLIFRAEAAQTVSWAGDPKKQVEFVDGNARLTPRGSFSTFLAQTEGKARPWTREDQILAGRLWPLLSAALSSEQKRRYMKDLHRQQELMIDELNHRVRNILALVQSVSTEAKKSQSSLESYSMAIEARIRALAAAHTIGSGSSAKQVDVAEIILQEATPYENEAKSRVAISGVRMAIMSELAPIFALTIHELMTNAAKYGALSNSTGTVSIHMAMHDDHLDISWRESGGPPVHTPNRTGFGTTLVKRAVPYELGGKSSHSFAPDGVKAVISLPKGIIAESAPNEPSSYEPLEFGPDAISWPKVPAAMTDGTALVLEDNFMISEGVVNQLRGLGFDRIEAAADPDVAMECIEDEMPSLAVLDVNLGKGRNSLPIAEFLLDNGVPIIFVTGYGELSTMTPRLSKQIVLTKPIDTLELVHAIARVGKQ